MAQKAQYAAVKPNQRHFTINRAFQPGMQTFPAITWTGDGQDCSHKNVLLFQKYGQLYTACDMTSPDATTLVRQYQNAVFLPIMRVHQVSHLASGTCIHQRNLAATLCVCVCANTELVC